jgi:methionine synthase I (cobalamin-dependent)
MNPLIDKLIGRGPVVTDGAWGTQMQARGLGIGECPDAWNLIHPDRVSEVALSYVDAGSRVILTNTFGANRMMLERHGLSEQVIRINREGAKASKRAAGDRACVFASIGPTGKMLFAGETTEQDLADAFEEQAMALAEGGADGLVVETMSDLAEAAIAVIAARKTGLPVVACMVFDTGSAKDRTMTGATPEQAAKALAQAGADVIGANCGQGIDGFVDVCRRMRASTTLPIWIKPNAGFPEIIGERAVYRTTPEEFAARIPVLVESGATFIGACCGSDPNFIRAIRAAIGNS